MTKHIRNAPAVLNQLVETPTGQVLCKVPCTIQVPSRYADVGLGHIGIHTYTYGLFALILETGEYAVCNLNALVELNPFKITTSKVDEIEYHNFHFDANQVVITTTDVLRRDTLMYNVIDEFIFKGKVPWFLEYEDFGKLFDKAKEFANSNIGQNIEVIELLASLVTRSKTDRSKYIRLVANSFSDISHDKIEVVPLKSIFYSVNSTVNKIAGNYFSDGVTSALVTPTTKVDKIESILRA
jgi:hypothetical protein